MLKNKINLELNELYLSIPVVSVKVLFNCHTFLYAGLGMKNVNPHQMFSYHKTFFYQYFSDISRVTNNVKNKRL